MKQGNLNIKIDYKALDTYKKTKIVTGSDRQLYNANKKRFEPDRRTDPCVIKVECGVNDVHGLVTGSVNASLVDVVWHHSTPEGTNVLIQDSNPDFKIGKTTKKGELTVLKNVNDSEPLTITFKARYIEPKTKRVCNFQDSFLFSTSATAEAPILIETKAPAGYTLFPTEQNKGLICVANIVKEKEIVPAAYYWSIAGIEVTDAGGYTGSKTDTLSVPSSKILKEGSVFVCEIADCSKDLEEMNIKNPLIKELPLGYRPSKKPSKLYKAEFMLIKQMPIYNEEILYPDVVSPESKTVQIQMVLNTNNGIIDKPEKLFSVGWLKQTDGSFKYKGFKINVLIEDILNLNASGKSLDYELREDLTIK